MPRASGFTTDAAGVIIYEHSAVLAPLGTMIVELAPASQEYGRINVNHPHTGQRTALGTGWANLCN